MTRAFETTAAAMTNAEIAAASTTDRLIVEPGLYGAYIRVVAPRLHAKEKASLAIIIDRQLRRALADDADSLLYCVTVKGTSNRGTATLRFNQFGVATLDTNAFRLQTTLPLEPEFADELAYRIAMLAEAIAAEVAYPAFSEGD